MPFVKGDKNINRFGRRKGSFNKNLIPKEKDVWDEIQRHGINAIKNLVALLDDKDSSPQVKQKINQWLVEAYFQVEDMKRELRKGKKENESEEKEKEEEDSVVVSFKTRQKE